MKKIIDYCVVAESLREKVVADFAKDVNDKINQGWEPLGGIEHTDGNWLLQAMVKYED